MQGNTADYHYFPTIDAGRYLLRGEPFPPRLGEVAVEGITTPVALVMIHSSQVAYPAENTGHTYISPAPGKGAATALTTKLLTGGSVVYESSGYLYNQSLASTINGGAFNFGDQGGTSSFLSTTEGWYHLEWMASFTSVLANKGADFENIGCSILVNGIRVCGQNQIMNGAHQFGSTQRAFRERVSCYVDTYLKANDVVTYEVALGYNVDTLDISSMQLVITLLAGPVTGVTGA